MIRPLAVTPGAILLTVAMVTEHRANKNQLLVAQTHLQFNCRLDLPELLYSYQLINKI